MSYSSIDYKTFQSPFLDSQFMKRVDIKFRPSVEFKRGDFITYYDPIVKSDCIINVQDWYWDRSKYDPNGADLLYKKWVYYKAVNLKTNHLYYDGSRMAIVFEDYPSARLSNPDEIDQYMEALTREGLTL